MPEGLNKRCSKLESSGIISSSAGCRDSDRALISFFFHSIPFSLAAENGMLGVHVCEYIISLNSLSPCLLIIIEIVGTALTVPLKWALPLAADSHPQCKENRAKSSLLLIPG